QSLLEANVLLGFVPTSELPRHHFSIDGVVQVLKKPMVRDCCWSDVDHCSSKRITRVVVATPSYLRFAFNPIVSGHGITHGVAPSFSDIRVLTTKHSFVTQTSFLGDANRG